MYRFDGKDLVSVDYRGFEQEFTDFLKSIGVGTESLTTNKKSEGRRWVCLDCLDAVLRCAEVKAKLDSVAFDDDGYYMALGEALDKDLAELCDRGIISCNDDLTF